MNEIPNPTQCEGIASHAIRNRPTDTDSKFHLCYWEINIQCLPIHHTAKEHPIFEVLTPGEVTMGLSGRRWRKIGELIHKFIKEQEKCKHLLKQSRPKSNPSYCPSYSKPTQAQLPPEKG